MKALNQPSVSRDNVVLDRRVEDWQHTTELSWKVLGTVL